MTYYKIWPQYFGIILMTIGFMFAISSRNSILITSLIIICFGFMFGRIWWKYKEDFRFAWFVIIAGFLIGIIIGFLLLSLFMETFSRAMTISLFIILYSASIYLSYYIHDRKIISSKEY